MAMSLHEVLERMFGVDEDEFTAALVEFVDVFSSPVGRGQSRLG